MNTTGTDTPGVEFGRSLRAWRRRAGLTQAQLGERVGYHHTLISKLESGLREPPAKLVRHLDDLLGARGQLAGFATAAPASAARTPMIDATLFSAIPSPATSDPLPPLRPHNWPTRLPAQGVPCPLHGTTGCEVPPPGPTFTRLSQQADPPPATEAADTIHGLTAMLACCFETSLEDVSTNVLGPVEQALQLLVRWARAHHAAGGFPRAQLQLAANYAQLAGRLRMQRGQNSIAMAWFGHGLRWAEVSDTLSARATLLTDLCTLARLDGDPTTELGYARALDNVDRERGWITTLAHTYQARAHALIGNSAECHRHTAAARRSLSRLDNRDRLEAPWLTGESGQVRVESAIGGAMRDLSVSTGDRAVARRGIHATRLALACLPTRMQPAYLLLTLRLADNHACAGDPSAAVAITRTVLDAVLAAGRATIRHELQGLRDRLTGWAEVSEARDLLRELRERGS